MDDLHRPYIFLNIDFGRCQRSVEKFFRLSVNLIEVGTNGKVTEWSVEWASPNQLGRDGYRPSTFPPGATVTLRVHPMANGAPVAGFIAAKFPDGRTIGKWDGA